MFTNFFADFEKNVRVLAVIVIAIVLTIAVLVLFTIGTAFGEEPTPDVVMTTTIDAPQYVNQPFSVTSMVTNQSSGYQHVYWQLYVDPQQTDTSWPFNFVDSNLCTITNAAWVINEPYIYYDSIAAGIVITPDQTANITCPLTNDHEISTSLRTWVQWNQLPNGYTTNVVPVNINQSLIISINIPSQMPYGQWPFTAYYIINNNSSISQTFTTTTWLGGLAWGSVANGFIYPSTVSPYWTQGDSDGWKVWWQGTINANETITLGINTTTQSWGNPYPVKIAEFNLGDQSISATTLLTEGPGLSGILSANKVDTGYYALELTTTAKFMGQFIAPWNPSPAFTSDCDIAGLPTGFVGNLARTWEYHLWYISIPTNKSTCTINGTIYHNEAGTLSSPITVSTTIDLLPQKTYIPILQQP